MKKARIWIGYGIEKPDTVEDYAIKKGSGDTERIRYSNFSWGNQNVDCPLQRYRKG